MKNLDVETIWQMSDDKLISLIESGAVSNNTGKINFYAPSFVYYKTKYFRSSKDVFPSISITGSSCALKCKHCDGRVLETMVSALTPEELFNVCLKLKKNGAVGCLISGGCLPDGSVPIDKFMNILVRIKQELGLTIVVHTGVINLKTAKQLKNAGVDAALIDIIGSNETIREVYNLSVTLTDYEQSLKNFAKVGLPFVPHVLVGLHYGQLKGELDALKMIAKYSPSAVITIAFMPIHGTPMENVSPPKPEDIIKFLASARLLLPKTPIVLGCMRPKGNHRKRTDRLAVLAGVSAIAFPVEDAIQLAQSLNLEICFSSLCCSQVFNDIKI